MNNPKITLYIANPLKLPFFKYSSKNLITITPTIKLAKTPITNGRLKVKCLSSYSAAAATIGVDNKKEYLATDSLFSPISLPTVIVIPDLDTPGKAAAIACDIEIRRDCFNVISLYSTFDFAFLSTMYKIIPITIKANAIKNISTIFSSTLKLNASFSITFSDILSKIKHNIPVGIVDITMYQNIFPFC